MDAKVTMPPKETFKVMCAGKYKEFNRADVEALRAILEYHRPYREWMAKRREQV